MGYFQSESPATAKMELNRIFVLILFVVIHNCFGANTIEKGFDKFIEKYNKSYKADSEEYNERLNVFKANVLEAEKLNTKRNHNSSAWYGITKFSDLSPQEFYDRYLSVLPSSSHRPTLLMSEPGKLSSTLKAIPKKKDWRDENIVTAVRNQKHCGGCWAFSTVETVESMYAKSTQLLQTLSIQEVIDCSVGWDHLLYGCKGGDTCGALSWMTKTGYPLVSESAYPLKDKSEKCTLHLNTTKQHGVKVKSYTCQNLEGYEKNYMLEALANHGPVAVSVDATSWSNYQGGIIQFHCSGKPNNHAVTIVGYDLTGEIPYYIVKNSWGADFGDKGYLYVKIGENICGIAREVSQVDVYT